MMISSLFIGSFIITFTAQILLCYKVKNKWLKHMPLLWPVVVLGYAVSPMMTDFAGGYVIALIMAAAIGCCSLAGCGLAWLIYRLSKKMKAKDQEL